MIFITFRNEFLSKLNFLHFTGVEISKFSLLPKRDIKKRGSSIIKVLKAERVERRGELLLKSNLTCGLWCTFDELSLFIAQLHHQYQAHHNRQVSLLQEKKTGCTGGKKRVPTSIILIKRKRHPGSFWPKNSILQGLTKNDVNSTFSDRFSYFEIPNLQYCVSNLDSAKN